MFDELRVNAIFDIQHLLFNRHVHVLQCLHNAFCFTFYLLFKNKHLYWYMYKFYIVFLHEFVYPGEYFAFLRRVVEIFHQI